MFLVMIRFAVNYKRIGACVAAFVKFDSRQNRKLA